ncbi:serine/threonine protein kinase [Glycomyces sp. TRM65418]|uniref:serine/threonine protein kinase n=1 Tax=Glycomyces sp. TRM65418 TaxID=2867006 RepID=UPI001CE55A2D|nr:serine/threonine protein kinase [Glycomyces sp. TRM65418]MCC3763162.1 serine/threonine protein kinase [Glycomyces sp. TRM65418]QZD57167.1 serine/threonine protein kinase [Glycomyces sp. TRM65418]
MEPGNLIAGRYRLEQRLAAGGMGAVWRGTDTRLNRAVAIKLLHAGLSGNDRFRARFHQEAQAVAALQSPGIVALYDYGEEHAPEGLVSYLIMELVRGQALDNVLRERGRLSPTETLKILASAAEALDVAHQAHIIHRDIKPGNLLVGSDGTVKIVDFGIAAAKGGAGLTETGTVMGTLAYASPEQLQGAQLTGATDLYSLGIVGYECLAGRPPFAGNEPTAAIAGHLTGQPAPLPPDVPGPVAQIIMRCLAKDPRQRFASAAEFARVCRAGGMGGGTTAILSPGSPPHQSPQATRAMSPAAAPAMGAGIVAAQTTVQPIHQGEFGDVSGAGQFGGGASERPLPPPREAEKPKRNPTGPILVVVAGIAVLLIALIAMKPWDPSGDGEDVNAGSSTAATSEAAEEATEAEAETTGEDDSEEDNDSNGDNQNNDNNDEESDEDAATTSAAPQFVDLDDYVGQDVNDAMAALEEDGFTNVSASPTAPDGTERDTCEILSQSPEGGHEVGYDTAIQLSYVANDDACPDGDQSTQG